jgi:hypothetical protein
MATFMDVPVYFMVLSKHARRRRYIMGSENMCDVRSRFEGVRSGFMTQQCQRLHLSLTVRVERV